MFSKFFKQPLLKDSTSVAARGRDRIRRAIATGLATLMTKGMVVAAGFVVIPLTANYLGTERFGLWLMIGTMLTWVSVTDLGLANSLTNVLATAHAKDDLPAAQEAVASAVWIMIGIASSLSFIFSVAYPFVSWEHVFNITSDLAKAEIGSVVVVGFCFFALRIPLSISNRIYSAYQEGYFSQLWIACSSWISIAALIIGINLKANLPVLLSISCSVYLIADLLSAIHLFYWHRPALQPRLQNFRWQQAKALLRTGTQFWLIQLAAIVCLQTDIIIVAQLFGASAVASYGVAAKLFSIISLVQFAFLMPLWSAYSEAHARRDSIWILKTFRKSIQFSLLLSCIGSFILIAFSRDITKIWINQEVASRQDVISAMAVLAVLTSFSQCFAILLNGLGQPKSQLIYGTFSGVSNLILSITFGNWIGIPGVIWATVICTLIFSIACIGWDTLKVLKKLSILTQ